MEASQDPILAHAVTEIEKLMVQLPQTATERERRFYLAGTIETLAYAGVITEEHRQVLYPIYAF